jgi:hypothetical protein
MQNHALLMTRHSLEGGPFENTNQQVDQLLIVVDDEDFALAALQLHRWGCRPSFMNRPSFMKEKS